MGRDTYTIGTTSELSPAYAKKNAMNEAVRYCESLGKEIMPVQTKEGSHRDAFGDNLATFDYTFRCLFPGDPQLTRPELRDPTININVATTSDSVPDKQPDSDLYTELRKLDRLRNDGIITDQEFDAQKRRILEKQK